MNNNLPDLGDNIVAVRVNKIFTNYTEKMVINSTILDGPSPRQLLYGFLAVPF